MRKRVVLLLVLAGAAGCTPPPPAETDPAANLVAALAAAEGDPQTLVELAGWAARYGWQLLPGRLPEWRADYPVTGSPVVRFVWEVTTRRSVPAAGVPADSAAAWGLAATTRFYAAHADTDSTWVRVAGVDSLGRQGPWSAWGSWADSTATAEPARAGG